MIQHIKTACRHTLAMQICDLPADIIAHVGIFLRDDTAALKSAFLSHRCFGVLQHKDTWGVVTVRNVFRSMHTIRVMRARQPQLRELTITVDLHHWSSQALNALNALFREVSFCDEIAVTFYERVNVNKVFKGIDTMKYRVTFASEITLPMHLDKYPFQYVNISIPAFRFNMYRDVIPRCQHVKIHSYSAIENVQEIELDNRIDPAKTKVYIECDDLDVNILVYDATCIDGIFIKEFFTSRRLDIVVDYYALHRIHVRELILGTLHLSGDIFPGSSHMLDFLKYVTAQTYAFEMSVYPWFMSLIQHLVKAQKLQYNQIYILAVHYDAFVAARLYQLVFSPDINICALHTKYANIHKLKCNQYLNLQSHLIPGVYIHDEEAEEIINSTDIQWLLSRFRSSHYQYVWATTSMVLRSHNNLLCNNR